MKLSRTLCCASVCVPLVACDPFAAPDSMLDEYVTRVGRVLDVEVALSPVPPAPALPRLRERTRPLPEFRVGMRDFLGLYGCGLQHVVGARNSGLGRVMHPSSRLEYELRFIRTADECLPRLERSQLADRLEAVTAAKREALADVAWNAVWGTREVEDLFTRSQGALRIGVDRNAVGNMAEALHRMERSVTRVLRGELDVDVGALDAVYQRWLSQPLAGQVIRSALLLTVRLNDATALVEARLGDQPLCHRKVQTRQARTMRSMFTSVYVGHVQPYLADVQHVRRELLPPLQALARIEGEGHGAAFDEYLRAAVADSAEGNHWQAFDQSVVRHTRAWQRLLEQCGMQPGSEPARANGQIPAPMRHVTPATPVAV